MDKGLNGHNPRKVHKWTSTGKMLKIPIQLEKYKSNSELSLHTCSPPLLNKNKKATCVGKEEEKLEPYGLLEEMQMVRPLWKTDWSFLTTFEIMLSRDPAISLESI